MGKTGLTVLRHVRHQARMLLGEHPPTIRYLFIDTDADTAAEAMAGPDPLPSQCVVLTRLNRTAHYMQREGLPPIEPWLPAGALYRLPRTSGPAAGIRAFGRLALLDHAKLITQKVLQEVEPFLTDDVLKDCAEETERLGECGTNQPRVYLLAGLAGGTGSGMLTDLAYLVKHNLRQHGYFHPDMVGILFVPPADATVPKGPQLANTYAALTELHHYFSGNRYQTRIEIGEAPVTDSAGPFKRCMLFQLPPTPNDREQARTRREWWRVACCGRWRRRSAGPSTKSGTWPPTSPARPARSCKPSVVTGTRGPGPN